MVPVALVLHIKFVNIDDIPGDTVITSKDDGTNSLLQPWKHTTTSGILNEEITYH